MCLTDSQQSLGQEKEWHGQSTVYNDNGERDWTKVVAVLVLVFEERDDDGKTLKYWKQLGKLNWCSSYSLPFTTLKYWKQLGCKTWT